MKIALTTDQRGRAVRCPTCQKPVRTRQHVVIHDGKPYHRDCAPKEES